jgi:hypothetical protein
MSGPTKCPECGAIRDPDTDNACMECHLRARLAAAESRAAALEEALRGLADEWGVEADRRAQQAEGNGGAIRTALRASARVGRAHSVALRALLSATPSEPRNERGCVAVPVEEVARLRRRVATLEGRLARVLGWAAKVNARHRARSGWPTRVWSRRRSGGGTR